MVARFFISLAMRTIIYIDGFNLYYGAVKGGPHKWLDLQKYFERLLPHDDIQRIYYFTARIAGPRSTNQDTYLRALATLPLVEIRLGKFKLKETKCRVAACGYTGNRFFKTPEEKQTDVAIGVQLLEDAYEDNCDRFVIVSGDSDLLPGVYAIKRIFSHKEVAVYVPSRHRTRGAATELRGAADRDKTLPQQLLRHCQFPARFADSAGGWIVKPTSW